MITNIYELYTFLDNSIREDLKNCLVPCNLMINIVEIYDLMDNTDIYTRWVFNVNFVEKTEKGCIISLYKQGLCSIDNNLYSWFYDKKTKLIYSGNVFIYNKDNKKALVDHLNLLKKESLVELLSDIRSLENNFCDTIMNILRNG